MSEIERWEPSEAAISAATPHVEAARRTDMHASWHARAALMDAYATDDRLGEATSAAERLQRVIDGAYDVAMEMDHDAQTALVCVLERLEPAITRGQ